MALQVCDAVRAGKPTDEHLLHTMGLVYKPAGQVAKLAEAYEAAVAVNPSEEMQRHLFGMHIRCGDLVKQQQVAMKLNRRVATASGLAPPTRCLLAPAYLRKSRCHLLTQCPVPLPLPCAGPLGATATSGGSSSQCCCRRGAR